ncbi:4-hydroxybenzoate 3-monooxygenase [Streptomyces sp. DSM 44915]|uniref:4-hydroxybenzoate 3-monooxygenase n=1 Tax=Streptomyces chisholmiae TaxID=3075540 RepID=A0ABU2JQD9_9ACTN|nr:4-hydroxybenzoate 3-monooxygenase [Streptomyces sp. DSM 44915]MDT0267212.1 4-hydroxybenzoate 3-monooxygenase [Streptomyces sp. DSM 44915]
MRSRRRTQVGIVGAGPAGLALANALTRQGVDCVVLERASRVRVEGRQRAGLVEDRTVRWLRSQGLADRLLVEATRHDWCDFRCLGHTVRVDYGAYSGGRQHYVYPQQSLVRDLVATLEKAGSPPFFSHTVRAVTNITGRRARLECEEGMEIECDYVVGCDGFRGISRAALPATGHRVHNRRYPYDWLTVLAEVDRPAEGVRYAVHRAGFAGMMPRGPRLSRFYLQCPPGEPVTAWPARRIVAELRTRLADGDPAGVPAIGALPEVRMLRMHSSVLTPLRHGRLLLAGDAAHVLTPSGAKGMNLAIADAAAAADALVARLRDGDEGPLAGYSAARLADVRRVLGFSEWLLALLHLPADPAADPAKELAERLATVRRLATPGARARAFAHRYVGSGVREGCDDGPD